MGRRKFIKVLGVVWAAAIALIMTNMWFLALMNGGMVEIYINLFNEMWPEYIMWFIVWPVITLALYYVIEDN